MQARVRGLAYSIYFLISLALIALILSAFLYFRNINSIKATIFTSSSDANLVATRYDILTAEHYTFSMLLQKKVLSKISSSPEYPFESTLNATKIIDFNSILEPLSTLYAGLEFKVESVYVYKQAESAPTLISGSYKVTIRYPSSTLCLTTLTSEYRGVNVPFMFVRIRYNLTVEKMQYLIDPFVASLSLRFELLPQEGVTLLTRNSDNKQYIKNYAFIDMIKECEMIHTFISKDGKNFEEISDNIAMIRNINASTIEVRISIIRLLELYEKGYNILRLIIVCDGEKGGYFLLPIEIKLG